MQPDRRRFLSATGAAALTAAGSPLLAAPTPKSPAETAVKAFFESLTPAQREKVCFDWDHKDRRRGLLRTFVANNWQVTRQKINSDFYTKKQRGLIHDVFRGLVSPEWYKKFLKQLRDDTYGKPWGADQSVAVFGEPGSGKFEMVITGRHQTLRADGDTEAHVAFGGPIFYGHAAERFVEKADHPGNVFWPQAVAANKVHKLLDDKQLARAIVKKTPREQRVGFRGDKVAEAPGLPVAAMNGDAQAEMQKVLKILVGPFRKEDRAEALKCLEARGGLKGCRLSFFADSDVGADGVYDNWRLEGPAFVWHFRGKPHVHVWVNVADDPGVKLNA